MFPYLASISSNLPMLNNFQIIPITVTIAHMDWVFILAFLTLWICIPGTSAPPCHGKSAAHPIGRLWIANPIESLMFPRRLALCLENSRLFQEFCFVDPNKNLILLQGIDVETTTSESYSRFSNMIRNCSISLIMYFLTCELRWMLTTGIHFTFSWFDWVNPRSSKALFRLSNQHWHLEDRHDNINDKY